MASLKEIKGRIASVQSTLKITSAMKMVSSAKLHKVQGAATSFAEYESRLSAMVATLRAVSEVQSPLMAEHTAPKRAVLVALASDTSLCGGFNNSAIKTLHEAVNRLTEEGFEQVEVIPIGEKMVAAVAKSGYAVCGEFVTSIGDYDYARVAELTEWLMDEYVAERIDCVEVVYHHFHSMGRQVARVDRVLPLASEQLQTSEQTAEIEYIFEPSTEELLASLVPYAVKTQMYEIVLDNTTSEHAARTVAMQTASDNANDLLEELRLTYNKRRQQAITDELADITSHE